ncbi:class III extradiol dioxygenase subunit B-like domain-containing protein [Actinomycetes bacterium KLBMP 9797]
MPLVAAAVCPHPPLIVPEVATGAAAELDDLRVACEGAVRRLAGSGAATLVVLGAGEVTEDHAAPGRVSFAPWGLDDPPANLLPLSLSVGGWLVNRVLGQDANYRMIAIAETASPADCAALGRRLDEDGPGPWALLVMGDGSARRGLKAPGYDDPRAPGYDMGVARALASADLDALRDLDPELSADLMVAGRAPWQVLAGAARGAAWRAELAYDDAPYGVAYFVATWERLS